MTPIAVICVAVTALCIGYHFGRRAGKAIERVDQIGKAATEAAAGDLVGRDALGLHEVSVYEVVALIVQDNGDAYALAPQEGGGG